MALTHGSRNGTGNSLSQNNVNQVGTANPSTVDRFARAPAAEGPYYAGARIQGRPAHLSGLSHQVNSADQTMRSGN
ncbi:hypothetical protein N7492_009221 [Penicillium capsulatum]|uniref:Uncharacterized protein n=1 Tax=Penicillium capsulatum TaxID=69766 RepID=A0A9W9LHP7_9EURO|nr:hypothetical protein N7492_009221 [Penicillium capsulatum]